MTLLLRLVVLLAFLELSSLLRVQGVAGLFAPDIAFAVTAAVALAGERDLVPGCALAAAILRAPLSAAPPLGYTAGLLIFAILTRETRKFISRERPVVALVIALVGFVIPAGAESFASLARGITPPSWHLSIPAAFTTAVLAAALVPLLRALPFTQSLMERRFGE